MGDIFGAIGAAQKSSAMNSMAANYSTQATQNLQLSNLSASSALASGEQAAGQTQLKGSQIVGAQTAGYASSGVDTSSGSPLQTMADTRMMSSYDQAVLRNNAARQAFGLKVQGLEQYQQGALQALGAKQGADAAGLQAGGDLLGGFTQISTAGMKLLG